MFIQFTTKKVTETRYEVVGDWSEALAQWCRSNDSEWDHIAVLTDDNVWSLWGNIIRAKLSFLKRPLVILTIPGNEFSKEFATLSTLVATLVEHRVHRRDILLCIGGGVVCDLGGLLAALYMRGLNYVNVPTTLMAQIDAAIGGKVGANFGLRKNLLGAFHHPRLVLIDPAFLETLPEIHFRTALGEAVKLAIAYNDEVLLNLLSEFNAHSQCDRGTVLQLIEHCLKGKLDLLSDDPYENDLDRVLNLGHGMAHALERLPIMLDGNVPLHGEAVSLGLAATIRYSFKHKLCSLERANSISCPTCGSHFFPIRSIATWLSVNWPTSQNIVAVYFAWWFLSIKVFEFFRMPISTLSSNACIH
jgi:3-dehydroquinate synthetase